jgi:excisionase family DNA binding protein
MPANEKQANRPLTKPEAALYVGTTIRHITRLCQERRIPYFLLAGTAVRFWTNDLDAWLEAQPRREAIQPLSPVRVTRPLAVKKVAKATAGPRKRGAE